MQHNSDQNLSQHNSDLLNINTLKKDFKKFLFVLWKQLYLPKPTRIQYAIADELQHTNGHLIIEAFRGVGKSWITSAYVVWRLWSNRQLEFLVISASSSRAIEFATFTKRLLHDIPFLNELLPDKRLGNRDSVLSFDVRGHRASHAPSVKAAGINGQITGSRADVIIADDVEIPNNSFSVETRQKLIQRTGEFINIIKPEGGRIIFLGTPQTQESIYTELPKSNMFKTVVFPVYYPYNLDAYEDTLAEILLNDLYDNPDLKGKPTDPERFNREEIERRKLMLPNRDFMLQYMLDTTLSDGDRYPLKLKDLIVMPLDIDNAPLRVIWSNGAKYKIPNIPNLGLKNDGLYEPAMISTNDYIEYEYKVMVIDPSGRGKDETAYVVLGLLGTKLYLLDFGGFMGGGYSDDTLEKLTNIARDYKVNKVLLEANYGDGMFTKLLTPKLLNKTRVAIEEIKNYTNKEKRMIDTLEPILTQHKLVVNQDSIEKDVKDIRARSEYNKQSWFEYSLCYQLTHLTYEKNSIPHDDRLDALAMGVAYFKDHMGVDEGKKIQMIQNKQREQEIRQHLADIGITVNKDRSDIRITFTQSKWV